MSKSLGNVVEPTEIIQKYGSDYLRYFLASEMNFGNDGDFSESSFHKKINELADDFGNLVQRDLVMINKHCNGILPIPNVNQLTPKDQELLDLAKIGQHQIYHNLNELNIRMICDIAIAITRAGNRYINEEEPWKLIKKPDGRERMEVVIYVIYNVLRVAGIYFQPIIPKTMENLFEQMNVPIEFRRINSITDELLPQGIKVVSKPSILFPKPQIPK
jgi:methionyl-tRNA synthetase